jgi:hypothetical protein
MPNNDKSKTDRADKIRKILAGLQKYFGNVNLTLLGTSYTPAALQAFLQADVASNDASTLAHAAWLKTVNDAQDTDAKTNPVLRAIRAQVLAVYGEDQNAANILAEFGYSPRKKVVLTAQQKADRAAKLRATRQARGTMGSRQKAKIHGTVPAGDVSSQRPAPTAAPAPSATSSSTSNSGSPSASPTGATNPSHQ